MINNCINTNRNNNINNNSNNDTNNNNDNNNNTNSNNYIIKDIAIMTLRITREGYVKGYSLRGKIGVRIAQLLGILTINFIKEDEKICG